MPTLKKLSLSSFSPVRKGRGRKLHELLQNFSSSQKSSTVVSGQKNISSTIATNQTTDRYFNINERSIIYTGIPNEIATKLILILMGFMVISIFLCIFLILAIYIYYKEKGEEFFTDNKGVLAKVRIDKANSPYIISPEQKITQQLLSAQVVTPVECSVNDIAQLLRYIALYGEFSADEIYRTPRSFIRLVTRGKTKFDEDDSRREKETIPKLESKLDLRNGKTASGTMKKLKKSMQQQELSSSKRRKKARRKELSDRLDYGSKVKRSSRRNAMRRDKKEKNGKQKSSKSRLNHQLAETFPHAHERLLNKKLKKKRSKRLKKGHDHHRKGNDRLHVKGKKRKHLKESKHRKK